MLREQLAVAAAAVVGLEARLGATQADAIRRDHQLQSRAAELQVG